MIKKTDTTEKMVSIWKLTETKTRECPFKVIDATSYILSICWPKIALAHSNSEVK